MSNTTFTSRVSGSRRWTLALGIFAAVLAAILLVAYILEYRSSVNESTAPTPVLVAKDLIAKGTSGTVIAQSNLFQTASLPKDDLKAGAISDPGYLAGRVTTVDIYPGQQITGADLSAGTTNALQTQITGAQRAVALPSAGSRGLVGFLADGDRVDIYFETGASGSTVLGLLASNVLVMRAPTGEGSPVLLRANARLAQTLALASDTGTLWYLLRPTTGAKKPPRKTITSQQLLTLITSQQAR